MSAADVEAASVGSGSGVVSLSRQVPPRRTPAQERIVTVAHRTVAPSMGVTFIGHVRVRLPSFDRKSFDVDAEQQQGAMIGSLRCTVDMRKQRKPDCGASMATSSHSCRDGYYVVSVDECSEDVALGNISDNERFRPRNFVREFKLKRLFCYELNQASLIGTRLELKWNADRTHGTLVSKNNFDGVMHDKNGHYWVALPDAERLQWRFCGVILWTPDPAAMHAYKAGGDPPPPPEDDMPDIEGAVLVAALNGYWPLADDEQEACFVWRLARQLSQLADRRFPQLFAAAPLADDAQSLVVTEDALSVLDTDEMYELLGRRGVQDDELGARLQRTIAEIHDQVYLARCKLPTVACELFAMFYQVLGWNSALGQFAEVFNEEIKNEAAQRMHTASTLVDVSAGSVAITLLLSDWQEPPGVLNVGDYQLTLVRCGHAVRPSVDDGGAPAAEFSVHEVSSESSEELAGSDGEAATQNDVLIRLPVVREALDLASFQAPLCKGTTRAGLKCKNRTLTSPYCWRHRWMTSQTTLDDFFAASSSMEADTLSSSSAHAEGINTSTMATAMEDT